MDSKHNKVNKFGIILLGIQLLIAGTTVYANIALQGNQVSYSNTSTTLQAGNVQSAIDELYVAASASFLDRMYPVGSIYISTSLSSTTAVANALGGTWESFGSGRTLISAGTGTDSNNTAKSFNVNSTGGEYTHKLTITEMPSHKHANEYQYSNSGSNTIGIMYNGSGSGGLGSSGLTGGDGYHNNIQPYITVYMYKRTK